jgi:hypothetical protein
MVVGGVAAVKRSGSHAGRIDAGRGALVGQRTERCYLDRVRLFVVLGSLLACLLVLAPRAKAQTALQAEQEYDHQKKSLGLAMTIEAICPIAGAGAFYVGGAADRATFLAILSGVSGAAGVAAGFWLVDLDGKHASGVDRAFQDFEQGTAITVLVVAGVVYLVARISGLELAAEATATYNTNLRQRLGAPPLEPVIPSHALAPGPMFTFRF